MYDIFAVSLSTFDKKRWKKIKEKYPTTILVENVTDIKQISSKSFTKMFWVIWDDIDLLNNFNLNEYRASNWDNEYVHVFKNGNHYDGLCLIPKKIDIHWRELKHRFFARKKEINITASTPIKQELDIVFISYNEPNADENFKLLKSKFPRATRVHGVTGIHNAHIKAAEQCSTDMIYVVDGDAIITDNFNFDYQVEQWNNDSVHVFLSKNPINDLVYGYGGVKLLPRLQTLNMDINTTDMTTSISNKFKAVSIISNVTAFNTDPFNTWKSAFRECSKLSSKIIARQRNNETDTRLEIWCTVGEDKPYGKFAILGAKMGKLYGETHRGNTDALKCINNFAWLEQKFKNEIH